MSVEIVVQDTTLAARDGFALAATVFSPAARPRHAVLISSATAVPRRIYRGFAHYLATRGATVVTYDYRGTGHSRPASLKGFQARMRDWAALDVSAAIDHMRSVWPALPLRYVGHSYGGQALGLAPNNDAVARALIVAAQSGYWRHCAGFEKYRVWAMLNLVVPPLQRLCGYVPGAKIGFGEDLPNGVFDEWRRWCMSESYFFDDATLDTTAYYPRYAGPLRAIGIDDDPWATAPAIDALTARYAGTQPERVQVDPEKVGTPSIGHFGFFRPERREPLWRDAADWLFEELAT
jgi:predicted alpha/beta hydrolase